MKPAFTLVEMLLASALSAVLMIALLSMSTTMARSERLMAGSATDKSDLSIFLLMLQHDVAQSQTVDIRGSELILTGHGALMAETLETHHQPVRIIYHLSTGADHSVSPVVPSGNILLREQSQLNDLTNRNTWSECVALGVKRFEVQPVQSEREASAPSQPDDTQLLVALRVEVEWADSRKPPVSMLVFTR